MLVPGLFFKARFQVPLQMLQKLSSSPNGAMNAVKVLARRLLTSAAENTAEYSRKEKLYRRLSALGATGETVSKTLNDYMVEEGHQISTQTLMSCAKQLRKYRQYQNALEIMEWMQKRKTNMSIAEHAVYLDLMSKARGVAAAEEYFYTLDKSAKGFATYGALLNCYCTNAMGDKALALYKEMEKLNFAFSTLVYNNLMVLYMKIGKPERVPLVAEEMKQKKVAKDSFTYASWMQSYARLGDIEGAEKVEQEMLEEDPHLCGYHTHCNMAAIYVKAGLSEKAEAALKKMENRMSKRKREAYHYLITLYAKINNRSEVDRIWCSLKSAFPITTNNSYLIMLQTLSKLKDIEGLLKCFKEWESSCINYDARVTNVAINACLAEGWLGKATALFNDALTKTNAPLFKAQELFMVFYLNRNEVSAAIKHLHEAVCEAKRAKWVPDEETINAFVQHFEQGKDIDSAQECFEILRNVDGLKSIAYRLIMKVYNAAGKTNPEICRMLEEDEVKIDGELERLLEDVCPRSRTDSFFKRIWNT